MSGEQADSRTDSNTARRYPVPEGPGPRTGPVARAVWNYLAGVAGVSQAWVSVEEVVAQVADRVPPGVALRRYNDRRDATLGPSVLSDEAQVLSGARSIVVEALGTLGKHGHVEARGGRGSGRGTGTDQREVRIPPVLQEPCPHCGLRPTDEPVNVPTNASASATVVEPGDEGISVEGEIRFTDTPETIAAQLRSTAIVVDLVERINAGWTVQDQMDRAKGRESRESRAIRNRRNLSRERRRAQ